MKAKLNSHSYEKDQEYPDTQRQELKVEGWKIRRAKKAAHAKKPKPDYPDYGIVSGTTPRDVTTHDQIVEHLLRIRMREAQLNAQITKAGRCTSKKPGEYDTVEEKGGIYDCLNAFNRVKFPSYPAPKRSSATAKFKDYGVEVTFKESRKRHYGLQVPEHL